jgi:hypothetical protein
LATNPEASTCFQFNADVLVDFLNADLNRSVDEVLISVDSMDNVLSSGCLWPDFIKVDAECADLEVLKGAENALAKNCLGVFVEVSFAKRHKGAPLFGEVDNFLQERNFILMDIFLERWIRKNNVTGFFTRHQVVWGDVLYVISRSEFLRRMEAVDLDERGGLFSKFLFILMLYQLYDYADEIIDHCNRLGLITHDQALEAKRLLDSAIGNSTANIFRLTASLCLSLLGVILFLPMPRLWRNNLLFFRIQFGELLNIPLRFAMCRYKGCIVDPINPSSRL